MKTSVKILLLIMTCGFFANAQDSVSTKKIKPEKPHEFGLSVHLPLLYAFGASENYERFSNLTYRYRVTEHHAIRALIGGAPPNNGYPHKEIIGMPVSPTKTLIPYEMVNTPSNFQLGVGYEYMRGKRLKHGYGVELIYNNKFEKRQDIYQLRQEEIDPNGRPIIREYTLDSTSAVRARSFDKFGFNVFFSLRYDLTKRLVLTGSSIASFRYVVDKNGALRRTNFDFNMIGLISDVSLFYRF